VLVLAYSKEIAMQITTSPTISRIGKPRRLFTRLKRVLLAVLALLIGLVGLGAGYEAIASVGDATRYPAPGQLVDIGGYRMHIHCMGSGSPTVVLNSGAGGFSAEWRLVQPELAKTARVCTFDRAGMGWSEPGPAPRSPAHIADELHALLTNAGIDEPIVLVAHSAGGKHARLYARRHPERVAGIVLVDARSEHVDDHLTPEQAAAERAESQEFQNQVAILSRFGVVRLLWAWGWPKALPATANLAPETRQLIGIVQARPQHQATSTSETDDARIDNDSLRDATLGATPLVVLAAGRTMQQTPNWRESQHYQAGLSTNSRLVVAEGSDHSIHWDRPALVIDAVRAVIAAARTGQALVQ
jgi:pimeloyl-ACP methyl ester carboxylesterase